jgi:trimethylamine--corrinoid protein Co-methyltransferase
VTADYIRWVKLTQYMDNMDAQSTMLVPGDVPDGFADRYRLYLSLLYCSKPVVTGIFAEDGLSVMMEMLKIIRDGSEGLRNFPLAIFDACPSPPLKWSTLTSRSLVECAREWIPTELVSMPLAGATAPVTLAESLVQHTVENLSGVIISQIVQPGAPIIYGGSPAIFDMRYGTTPMGAIETVMIDCAYTAIGKRLGLPTHAYLGLSDAKSPDFQAGSESTFGLLLGILSGVNMISGPGMLDFESTQCLEKLVLDNETCGSVRRLSEGIRVRDHLQADNLLKNIEPDFQFLSHPHTLKWFREEHLFPADVIDRQDAIQWESQGSKTAADRAREKADHILEQYDLPPLPEEKYRELTNIIQRNAAKFGMDVLPSLSPDS